MPDFISNHPILAAWGETVRRQPGRPGVFSDRGTPLRSFAEIENEALELAGVVTELHGDAAIALVEIGNHPALPAVLIALWRKRYTVALAEIGNTARLPGITLRVTRGGSGDIVFSPTSEPPAKNVPSGFLKLTSGTTGAPRAICFTAAQLLADCAAICDTMEISDADLNYGAISWAHSYGFSNLVLPLICRGIPLVATEDRLPRAILDGLARTRATVFPAVPVFFKKLAGMDGPPLPKLRLCISAGAPLPAAVAAQFRERFGVKVHGFYGSSECGGISYDASEDVVTEGFVGPPMRGVRLVENGGRIEVHSSAAGLGYWPEPDAAVLGNGRFVPEDLVEQTERGISLKGRVSDFINVAGRKLNPAEIERVFREHPGVREVVVFGVPSALRGEEPVACVVGEVPPQALLAFAAGRLPAWQTPKHVWPVLSLPINERGKLSRRALAERWVADRPLRGD